ncbi:dethiobiotin synthase [Xanthomonadaceae bacterium JHOS43]|nr:dethiobiotin synthase [Xanthomonadaceae bacterium JHOS43]MCX7562199.1 dethiobiotin synthase [Xanthomonadaceae bacterium XH05]
MTRAFFITGTDTGIGKTVAACALLRAFAARGLRAVGMKPVAAGCERTTDGWRNEDALALIAAGTFQPDYALVNPVALPEPTTPELAATCAGADITLEPIVSAFRMLASQADVIVIEGAGGWLAPWSATLDQSALVKALDLSVILVCGLKLGCISHARLSARTIPDDGCRLAGWIGNRIDPNWHLPDANTELLASHLPAPCLGMLPILAPGDAPPVDALTLDVLMRS